MKVSVEVYKIIYFIIYDTILFISGGGVYKVLVRLSLIKQIIEMPIRCAFHSVSNIQRHFGNCA